MTEPAAGIGPFQATVESVYALIPEMDRVTDPNNSSVPTPITDDTIRAWILEVSGAVSAALGAWRLLDADAEAEIVGGARAIVANGVASYVEAARYPTRSGLNDSSYAGVLWNRYTTGLAALTAVVKDKLDTGADVDPGDTSGPTGGPFGAFPAPFFPDGDPYSPWCEPVDPRAAW